MVIDLGQASVAGEAKTNLFGIVLIWNPIEFHKPRLYTETLLGFVIGLGILSAGFGSPYLVFWRPAQIHCLQFSRALALF